MKNQVGKKVEIYGTKNSTNVTVYLHFDATSLELRGHVDNLHFHLLDNILIVLPSAPINPQTQPQAAP